jgi:hypothetical protein
LIDIAINVAVQRAVFVGTAAAVGAIAASQSNQAGQSGDKDSAAAPAPAPAAAAPEAGGSGKGSTLSPGASRRNNISFSGSGESRCGLERFRDAEEVGAKMNQRLLSVARDCLKFSLFAVIPGILGGFAHDWWVGFKLRAGFSAVFVVAMCFVHRRDLWDFIRSRRS